VSDGLISHLSVYLHVCGGTLGKDFESVMNKGLSPRVRRYRLRLRLLHHQHGSISTCAEVPRWRRSGRHGQPVYLHVCGGTMRESWWA